MSARRFLPGFLLAIALCVASATTAASQAALECRISQKANAIAELMFGRNIGGRLGVTEAKWRRFVDREITPRFPAGLTITDARGQWQDARRKTIVREPSKIVMIILPGEATDNDRLGEIVAAYKTRFRQDSVGLIVRPACVSF
jgi:hypothetical protein